MKAKAIVDSLLEADIPPEDTPELSSDLYKGNPVNQLTAILRDELVERGWRKIRINQDDEPDLWVVTAGFIDSSYRAYWENAGVRVAPAPEDSLQLRGKITRTFSAACRRAGVWASVTLLELTPVHVDGLDLYYSFDDFEDDPGDWHVTLQLKWLPKPGFWSKASKALGYEAYPYQQAQKPPPTPAPKAKSLLTPEQQDAADERLRATMRDLRDRAMKSSKEFDANLKRWKQEIENGADPRVIPPYLM